MTPQVQQAYYLTGFYMRSLLHQEPPLAPCISHCLDTRFRVGAAHAGTVPKLLRYKVQQGRRFTGRCKLEVICMQWLNEGSLRRANVTPREFRQETYHAGMIDIAKGKMEAKHTHVSAPAYNDTVSSTFV